MARLKKHPSKRPSRKRPGPRFALPDRDILEKDMLRECQRFLKDLEEGTLTPDEIGPDDPRFHSYNALLLDRLASVARIIANDKERQRYAK